MPLGSHRHLSAVSRVLSALQGRQKLARFNAREFATLIIDILSEAKRRQQGKSLSSPTGGKGVDGAEGSGQCSSIFSSMAPFWDGMTEGSCGGSLSDWTVSSDNLELSARSQSDLDDQHDYDSVASDEDTDQEPLRSAGATRNNRARV